MSGLLKQIEKEAKAIRDKILKRQKPSMRFPLRNLSNVKFDPRAGFFEMGRKTKERKSLQSSDVALLMKKHQMKRKP